MENYSVWEITRTAKDADYTVTCIYIYPKDLKPKKIYRNVSNIFSEDKILEIKKVGKDLIRTSKKGYYIDCFLNY